MVRGVRFADLAAEARLELDEALVTLWDNGLDSLRSGNDTLSGADLSRARRSLGLPGTRDLARCAYWRERLKLSEKDFSLLLGSLQIHYSPLSRNLPKGAISKLRRVAEERDAPAVVASTAKPQRKLDPAPPFVWRIIGRERVLKYLTADDLGAIHWELVQDFADSDDPISPPGVRDIGLVESAAMRPQTSLGGERKYKTTELAAAALLHSTVHNHAFHNGNKRTALVAFLVFLDQCDVMVTCDEDELFKFILRVAQHRVVPRHWDQLADREVQEIAHWIRTNSRGIDRAERLIKWHKLRGILATYDCILSYANVGNRVNIERETRSRSLFSRSKKLRVQAAYGDEGREVDRDALRHIRKGLHLDEEHGIDSELFYGASKAPSDFILKYRKTLARLAKL